MSSDSTVSLQTAGVNISGTVGPVAGDIIGRDKIGLDEEKLVAVLEAKGLLLAADMAGLQRRTVIMLAQRLKPDESLDFDQALTELERAVRVALDVITKGAQGASEDEFVNAVLAKVADKTQSDDLDGGARVICEALGELDRQEAKQRATARRKRVAILEAGVRQHTLRRDGGAVATHIEMLVAVNFPGDPPAWHTTFREKYEWFKSDGETKGINFSLGIAIELARRMATTASNATERWTATILLANALRMLGTRESGTARLEAAVAAYRAALYEKTRDQAPLEWAAAQTGLATALWRLGERESGTARLQAAATACRAALQAWSREREPSEWAMAQLILGNVLATLGERESRTEPLQEAVAAYRAALAETRRDLVPLQWAGTQNDFGIILWRLGEREEGTERLEEAIAAYRAALEEATRERVPLDWAATQDNLGIALEALGARVRGTAPLEEAVAAYRAALEERTRERVPLAWAATQNNLGLALSTLGARDNGTTRLVAAVTAHRAALEELTPECVPLDWARAQWGLGIALSMLGERTSDTALLEEATAACSAALETLIAADAAHYVECCRKDLDAVQAVLAACKQWLSSPTTAPTATLKR